MLPLLVNKDMAHSLLILHMISKQSVPLNYLSRFLRAYFQSTAQDQCTSLPLYSTPMLTLDSTYFLRITPLTKEVASLAYKYACARSWDLPSLSTRRIFCCCSAQLGHWEFYSNHDLITQPRRFYLTTIQLLFASRCLALV